VRCSALYYVLNSQLPTQFPVYNKGAVCCSLLQYFTLYCSVLQCVAVCCIVFPIVSSLPKFRVYNRVAGCCSALLCAAVRCSALQCVAVRCSALQCAQKSARYSIACIT